VRRNGIDENTTTHEIRATGQPAARVFVFNEFPERCEFSADFVSRFQCYAIKNMMVLNLRDRLDLM
jgi:hypothetical protein